MKKGHKWVPKTRISGANSVVLSEPQITTRSEPANSQIAMAEDGKATGKSGSYRATHVQVVLADKFNAEGMLDSGANVSAISLDFYRQKLHGKFR